ncbi:gephyrin-like molybdotransferase receptor GlpR [Corynebacterium sp. NPDC060344]|uniref:divisome protein SepX/GlpR n=1 Tax=Corynebacterium sp. NPDC060344 TaxID=3347101 RepID=UPI00365E4FA5
MSSSLLLVLIVVVWLFVLAPLVVNTRQPIRRTSEALGRTRLLHQGGESVATRRRRPTLTERDVRKPGEEVDESLETVDAELDDPIDPEAGVTGGATRYRRDLDDDILIDDLEDADHRADRADRDASRAGGAAAGAADADRDAAEEVPAVVEGDVVYELEAADAANDADTADLVDAEVAPEAGSSDDAISLDDAPARAEKPIADGAAEDVRAYLSPEDFLVVDDSTAANETAGAAGSAEVAETREAESVEDRDGAAAAATSDAVEAESAEERDDAVLADDAIDAELDAELDGERDGDREYEDGREPAAELDDTLTDDDLAFAERRRGRGGFDPVSDARYAETRFARRRRSVGVLAAFIIIGVALGAFVGGWAWWLPLAGAGLLVLYLVYLRRTVLAENELRARRIRRMKMARLGVRNSEDEELGIPERLRRPGAVVVELDDEDPDFADLPYSTYEFPEEDIRRAAGQ